MVQKDQNRNEWKMPLLLHYILYFKKSMSCNAKTDKMKGTFDKVLDYTILEYESSFNGRASIVRVSRILLCL